MKNAVVLASAVLTSIALLSGPAGSQGEPQTVGVAAVDSHNLSDGYRASKVIGSTVLNNANDSIGKIDDILVSSDGKEPYAVISVGSFLGTGGRLIIVRYDSLKLVGNKVVLSNGTKEGLKALPEFNYAVQ
jgi:sporulation protein YlmC with PRC-barrel domain